MDCSNGDAEDQNLQMEDGDRDDVGDKMPGEEEKEEEGGDRKKPVKGSLFHIDTSRIHAVPTMDQASELQSLGVSVFDQDEFEKGVLEQVDEAIYKEESKLTRQRDEKELKTVLNDIRTCRSELRNLQRVAAGIRVPPNASASNKGLAKKLMSVVTQKENKAKQLKSLRAKHRTLSARLNGDIAAGDTGDLLDDVTGDGDEAGSSASAYEKLLSVGGRGERKARPEQQNEYDVDAGPSTQASETEQERLIRLGEMTPFGTSLTVFEHRKPKPRPLVTDFEKFLGEKDVATYKKHKVATKWKGAGNKNKAADDDGSILRGLLVPKTDPKSSKTDKSNKNDKSARPWVKDSRGKAKKSDRERMEFEPKFRKKASDEFNGQRSKVKKRSMIDLTENVDSDYEDYGNGDDDYDPGNESGGEAALDDSDYSDEPETGRQYARTKKRKYADEIADGTIASLNDLKRKYGVRARKAQEIKVSRARDDATQDQFLRRLKEHKRNELRQKQIKIMKGEEDEDTEDNSNSTTAMDSDEEDVELDGGFKIPSKIWRRLYRYQKIGVKWLWELHRQKAGGILGDEMGLGKTIQIIAFLAGLKTGGAVSKGTKYKGLGPVLIVTPATVLHQWVKEFHSWYPEMRVAVLHESGSHSGKKEALLRDVVSCHGIIITSYSNVRIRQEMLLHFNWHYVILDEGHKIRNPDAEVTLACKQFRTPHRLILTGSPMQNNLRELWSLIDFVFPGKLGTLPVFMQQFSVPIVQGGYANASKVQVQTAYKCACILRDSISPYLLRRMKADVQQALNLPSKSEQVLFCHLTEEQTQVYEDYLASKECNLILRGEYKVFAGLIALRKICNHPDLVTGGPKVYTHQNLTEDQLSEEERYGYWRRAGKMIVVESLLKLWKEQNHRVLLFSQSKQMLDIIEKFVKDKYSYMRMDGTTPIVSRQPLINKYNSDSRIFLFLLTTRVGGLGVNLTGSNRVIIYDPDWNPSTDTQARERSWRIGQNRQVTIYRLLTAGSIEEKIYHRQIFKTFLTNRVLKDPRQRRFFKSNDLFELFTLGSAAKNQSTETSAIFAGTGSEVRPGPRASNASAKAKPGPVIKLGKEREDAEKARRRQKREEMVKKELKMKMKKEVKMRRRKEAETKARVEKEAEMQARVKDEPEDVDDYEVSESSSNLRAFHVDVVQVKMEPSPHGNASSSSSSLLRNDGSLRLQGGEICSSQNGAEEEAKPGGFFPSAKRLKVTPSSSSLWSMSSSSSALPPSSTTQVHSISSSTSKAPASPVSRKSSSETLSLSRKDKKKKRRDAKLDGLRIPNLARTKSFVPKMEDEDDATKSADQDNYVLAKLFKKSGVHSALQHDNIMQSSNPDFVLVENEAERVAKEAANAVKQSRRRCYNATSGIPTWTGNAGGSSGPKPRFGGKSNSRLVDNTAKKETPKPGGGKKKLFGGKKKAFSGDMSTASTLDEDAEKASEMPSSGNLLNNMRARNHLTSSNTDRNNSVVDVDSDDELSLSRRVTTPTGTEHDGLMTELVEFIGNRSRVPGQAATDELLSEFSSRIESSSSALFRSMLRQVCTFHRTSKEGFWRLKSEFL